LHANSRKILLIQIKRSLRSLETGFMVNYKEADPASIFLPDGRAEILWTCRKPQHDPGTVRARPSKRSGERIRTSFALLFTAVFSPLSFFRPFFSRVVNEKHSASFDALRAACDFSPRGASLLCVSRTAGLIHDDHFLRLAIEKRIAKLNAQLLTSSI